MKNNKLISTIIAKYSDESKKSLFEVLKMPTFKTQALANKPFGQEIDKMADWCIKWAQENGADYTFKHPKGYYAFADWGIGDNLIGVIPHMDVVSPADLKGWKNDPFEPTLEQNYVYARGASDTKGPAIASMYAIKYLKDNKVDLKNSKIRLLFGLEEELTMNDIDKYYQEHGEFNGHALVIEPAASLALKQKGRFVWRVEGNTSDDFTINGGVQFNIVCDLIDLKFNNKNLANDYVNQIKTHDEIEYEIIDELTLKIHGKPAHGSMPEAGVNALLQACLIFKEINYTNNNLISWISNVVELDYNLVKLVGNQTDETGKLTFNIGMIRLDNNKSYIELDNRVPAIVDARKHQRLIESTYNQFGLKSKVIWAKGPVSHDPNSKVVKKLQSLVVDYSIYNVTDWSYLGGLSYSNVFKNAYTICVAEDILNAKDFIPVQFGPHAYNERFDLSSWEHIIAFYVETIMVLIENGIKQKI